MSKQTLTLVRTLALRAVSSEQTREALKRLGESLDR
jgi:hypothetical protein